MFRQAEGGLLERGSRFFLEDQAAANQVHKKEGYLATVTAASSRRG
jgi:hypothetical protein